MQTAIVIDAPDGGQILVRIHGQHVSPTFIYVDSRDDHHSRWYPVDATDYEVRLEGGQ